MVRCQESPDDGSYRGGAGNAERDLYEQYQAAGKKSGYVYEEIAECLTVMGQEQEAQGWFAAAYEELSKDPRLANEQDRLERLKELGKVSRPETPGH
jgi:hypothetical protein